ncbi:MAG: hypothetical protein AB7O38_26680 [Pirellulaceae bacterium]
MSQQLYEPPHLSSNGLPEFLVRSLEYRSQFLDQAQLYENREIADDGSMAQREERRRQVGDDLK